LLKSVGKVLFWGAALASLASTAAAGTFVAFGPFQYVRDPAKPGPVTKTFKILDPTAPYMVRIDAPSGVSTGPYSNSEGDFYGTNQHTHI